MTSNPARVAHAPKRRPLATTRRRSGPPLSSTSSWPRPGRIGTRASGSLPTPGCAAARCSACVGRRRPRDRTAVRLRSLASVGRASHETCGESRTARRAINLDPRTYRRPPLRRQQRSQGGSRVRLRRSRRSCLRPPRRNPTHPQLLSDAFQKLVRRAPDLPRSEFHDLRHTHATLLLKAGVPIKVVSERLGHSTPRFTMATYQHVVPGMQARSGRTPSLTSSTAAAIHRFYPVEVR